MIKKLKRKNGVTSEIKIQRCSSCGAILQISDPKRSGYITPSRYEKGPEPGMCDRCYNLSHFNVSNDKNYTPDYLKIVQKAKETQALVVYVLDLFTFEASIIPNLGKELPSNVLVLLNKRDVLPKGTDDKKLIDDTRRRLAIENIDPVDIVVLSSSKSLNVDNLFDLLNEHRRGKDVYFIGASKVGKSSIINTILKQYKNETTRMISTTHIPGTNLDVMEIPLDMNSSIYDTPGIYNPKSCINQLERHAVKYIVPQEEIIIRTYTSNSNQSYLLGGIGCINYVEGPKSTFSFHFSNDLAITRVKMDRAEKTFASLTSTRQVKPTSEKIHSFKDLEKHEVHVPASGKIIIFILGLGKIEFEGANQKFEFFIPKNVGIKIFAR
ncbi:MAG: GTPase RsgA [Bacilli bacterium]